VLQIIPDILLDQIIPERLGLPLVDATLLLKIGQIKIPELRPNNACAWQWFRAQEEHDFAYITREFKSFCEASHCWDCPSNIALAIFGYCTARTADVRRHVSRPDAINRCLLVHLLVMLPQADGKVVRVHPYKRPAM
jgi:hypothetical protein